MRSVRIWLVVLIVVLSCSPAFAFGRWRRGGGSYTAVQSAIPAGCSNATAQGVAEIMARCGQVGHWGGNPGYEGCGCGATPEAAYAICCYANSGMRTVDVGYARGNNGFWYCCRRYR